MMQVKSDAAGITARAAEHGLRIGSVGKRRFRLVTHYWIDDAAVADTLAILQQVIS